MSTVAGKTRGVTIGGSLALNAFLVVGWLVTVAPFFEATVSADLAVNFRFFGLLVYPILLALAVAGYWNSRGRRRWTWWPPVLVGMLAALSVYGWARGNAPRVVAFDAVSHLTIICGILIGACDSAWHDMRRTVALLTAISVVLALMFTDPLVLADRSLLNLMPGSHFEAALILAPLFCLAAALERNGRWYRVFLSLSLASFLVYLYFGRRGISARCAAELAIILIFVPVWLGRWKRAAVGLGIALAAVVALVSYFPFDTLLQRFQGKEGTWQTLTAGNERWQEAAHLIEELRPDEWIVGRGMGGSYSIGALEGDVLIADDIDDQRIGRTSAHVGAMNLLLKGGVLLDAAFYIPALVLIFRLRRSRRLDPLSTAAAFAVIPWLAFQAIEGVTTYSTPWVGFGVGLMLARVRTPAVPREVKSRPAPLRGP